jgi:hypothetical protein
MTDYRIGYTKGVTTSLYLKTIICLIMKNPILYILALPACFMLAACPYESAVPIDPPRIKINSAFLGTWQDPIDSTKDYQVSEQSMFTYKIIEKIKDATESKQYQAYISTVDETTFLNLWEDIPGEDSPAYLLYKLEIRNANSVLLIEVTENIDEKFSSSDQLKSFIRSNMSNSYFFSKTETELIRVGK